MFLIPASVAFPTVFDTNTSSTFAAAFRRFFDDGCIPICYSFMAISAFFFLMFFVLSIFSVRTFRFVLSDEGRIFFFTTLEKLESNYNNKL